MKTTLKVRRENTRMWSREKRQKELGWKPGLGLARRYTGKLDRVEVDDA